MIASLAMTAAPVAAQDEEEEATDLDRFEVTGSRIKRTDVEGALPVTVIDRDTIEFSGKSSVADLLRNQPMNSAGSFRPQSGSTGQSFAGLSLRALGEGRTLILIDGRRAPIAPNIGSAQDLNSIPLGAVERIEILSDGASAVYGSDAIGGVVNIITRKDFSGAEIMLGTSEPEREGGDRREGHAIFGIAGSQGNIMAGVSNNKRDIIFARDREWSQGGASIFSNNFLYPNFTFFDHPQFGSANVPGCQDEGFFTANQGSADGRCFYDFTLVSADEAAVENQSLFVRSNYNINRDWTMYANAQVNRVTSFGRYAPVPSSPWLVGGFGAIVLSPGLPNHPATPPSEGGLNPNWEAYQDAADQTLLLTHRFAANGPRDTSTDAQVYDFDIGVQGRVGNFDIDAGVRRTESQYFELGRNYIVSALAQPQFDNGNYNIYDPSGNPQEVLQSFTATINRDARFVSREAYALASTDLFDMAAGPVGIAFGAEYRDEDYKDIFDDLQANGNITGSAGNSAFGSRDQWAVFGEALFPLMDNLELTAAIRHDDYSDFGSATSPKVALRFQPLEELTLRASWGEGFRAPPLNILAAQPAFSATDVVHPPTAEFFGNDDPNASIQITDFSIANPDLGAENSEQFGLGVAFEPLEWFNGSIDYFNIEITDRVAAIGAQQIVNCLEGTSTNCPPGLSEFPSGSSQPNVNLGLGAEFGSQGQIVFVQSGFASLGTIETDGFDLNLRTNFDFGGAGRLNSELAATHTMSYEIDSGDDVSGDAGLPEWRAVLSNVYRFGDFAFSWNINYIGDQDSSQALGDEGSLPSWTTHDVQVNWFTPWNGRLTVGATNLADKDPVLDEGELRGFNFNLYNAYGRVPYVRYTQSF
jgi:iron complex outermembrane receptor protein